MLERLIAASMFDTVACALAYRDESLVHLRTRSSMFGDVARAHLSLTLPGWLLHLCLTRSMRACAQWLLCCALVHEDLSSDTCRSSSPIVVVNVAFAQRDMKVPCACARGLVINICHCHCRSCCPCHRHATRRECKALLTTSSSSLPLFLSLLPLCNAMCCHVLAHKALLPLLPCNVTCCHALAHKAWLPLPPCDATCCCALAHEALLTLLLCDAMCQQLVRLCTLLLQYETCAHAQEGLLVDNI
jgi:hypothetical protein